MPKKPNRSPSDKLAVTVPRRIYPEQSLLRATCPERSRGKPSGRSTKPAPEFSTEQSIRARHGVAQLVGVDEVGRGALAGPLVVCALEITSEVPGVTDSKLLAPARRLVLAGQIRAVAEQIRFGWATNSEIDRLGLAVAQRLAYQRALADIEAELILTDNVALERPHISKVRGDQYFYSVAAASIIAKTLRDTLMRSYHQFFPDYFWAQNAGYGTRQHFDAIARRGPTKLHRQSFL